MKKILILGIIGIIALSTVGCAVNSSTQNSKSNYESKSTSTEKATSADSSDNKAVTTGDASININSNATIDEKIALEEVNNINIEISAAKVSIKAYDGEEIKITGKLSEKSKGMIIDKKGTKFEIVEKEYNLTGSFINNDNDKSIIDVLIPIKFKGEFAFKQGAGAAYIEGIKVNNYLEVRYET